jgi:hypothetical protein
VVSPQNAPHRSSLPSSGRGLNLMNDLYPPGYVLPMLLSFAGAQNALDKSDKPVILVRESTLRSERTADRAMCNCCIYPVKLLPKAVLGT